MSYRDRLVDRALLVAAQSEHPRWFVGAIVVRGQTLLSAAPNKVRKVPWLDSGRGATFHAEEAAIRRLRISREGLLAVLRSWWAGSPSTVSAGSRVPA